MISKPKAIDQPSKEKRNSKKPKGKKAGVHSEIGLSLTENNFRKSVISDLEYGLVFFLYSDSKLKGYEGMASLHFRLQKSKMGKEGPLCLDYRGKEITELRINGTSIKNIEQYWKQSKLELPTELLTEGENHVEVYFTNEYSDNNLEGGLVLAKDKDDLYFYTITKPFHSHKIYPCFDQQNIKANMKLLIAIPENNKVLSNDMRTNIDNLSSAFSTEMTNDIKELLQPIESKFRLWAFNPTDELSTGAFGFMGGSFESVKLSEKVLASPKLAIHAKHSLAKYLKQESENISLLVVNALEYLEGFFGRDYPFGKCDIVFLPDLKGQEIDLAGCCVLSENLLFSYEDDLQARISRSVKIIQQLVLAWLGHSVTPTWCADNWLDQGLSLYLAHLCLVKIGKSSDNKMKNVKDFSEKNVWNHFTFMKELSLIGGNISVQYPVVPDIQNTEEYEALDSSANQWRAAAVWRQLVFLVGEDSFKRGIKKCLSDCSRDGFINTEVFVETFDRTLRMNNETPMGVSNDHFIIANTFNISNFDFKQWVEDWVYAKGVSHLEVGWEKNKATYNNLVRVNQSALVDGKAVLRKHRVKFAFLDEWGQIFKIKDVLIEGQEHTNLILEDPQQHPCAFLLDCEGNSIFTSAIDVTSLEFFIKNLPKITDELAVSTVIQRCAEMVTKGKLPGTDYIHMVSRYFKEIKTIPTLLFQQAVFLTHHVIEQFIPQEYHGELKAEMFNVCLSLLREEGAVGQIALNEIWRFIGRREQVRSMMSIMNREIAGYTKMTVTSVYLTYKACYLVDKDRNHQKSFVEFVHAAGLADLPPSQELISYFEQVVSQEFEKDWALIDELWFPSNEIYSFEAVKGQLRSPVGHTLSERLFSKLESKGEQWSVQSVIAFLEMIWKVDDNVKSQEELLKRVSKLKIKSKGNAVEMWAKTKTEHLTNKKAAYRLF